VQAVYDVHHFLSVKQLSQRRHPFDLGNRCIGCLTFVVCSNNVEIGAGS
jgi:hypothetical protein